MMEKITYSPCHWTPDPLMPINTLVLFIGIMYKILYLYIHFPMRDGARRILASVLSVFYCYFSIFKIGFTQIYCIRIRAKGKDLGLRHFLCRIAVNFVGWRQTVNLPIGTLCNSCLCISQVSHVNHLETLRTNITH